MFRRIVVAIALVGLTGVSHMTRAAQSGSTTRQAAKPAAAGPVNINAASATELEGLPGIGAKTASRIIEYRQKNGPFKKVEELMNVRGVGEKNFLKLKDQISVGTKTDRVGAQQP